MFRFADIGRMWVPLDLPVGDGGEPVRIHLLQTLYTRSELRAREATIMGRAGEGLQEQAGQLRSVEDVQAMVSRLQSQEDEDLAALVERTHDWREVVGDDGKPAAFSRERLQALLELQWFSAAARTALFKASREGVPKNSPPGPGGSPGHRQA
jgi:hypothetical protein